MSDEKKNPESGKQEHSPDIEKKQMPEEKDGLSLDDDGPSLVERYAAGDDMAPEKGSTGQGSGAGGDEDVPGRVPPTIGDDSSYFSESPADEDFDEAFDFSEGADGIDDFGEDFDDDELTAPPSAAKKKAGSGKRFVAPLAVLLLAGGVGAYIVMNPDVIGGGVQQGAPVSSSKTVSTSVMPSPRDSATVDMAEDKPAQPANDAVPLVTREGLDRPFAGQQQGEVASRDTAFDAKEPEFPVTSDEGEVDVPRAPSIDTAFADTDQGPAEDRGEGSIPEFGAGEDLEIDESAFSEPDTMVVAEAGEEAVPVPDESQLEEVIPAESDNSGPDDTATSKQAAGGAEKTEDTAIEGDLFDVADIEPVSGADEMPVADDEPVVPKPPAMPERKADSPYSAVVSETSSAASRPVRTAQNKSGDGRYFDAGSQVPSGSMATEIGPRKVDPSLEPAQKYMMVTETKSETDPEALLATANRALKLQRYDAAIEMFEQLYARNNRDPRILMGLAVSLQKAGRTDASLSVYDELIEVAPGDKSAVVNMLGLLRAQYPSVAVRRLVDLQRQYPNDPMIAAQLGVTLADMGEYDDAEKYIGMAISLEPRNAQHYMNMAVIADRQGSRSSAISYYEEALQVDAVYGNGRSINRESVYDRLSVLRR